MPGRPRGRAVPQEPAGDAYPGYPGYGGHPDDGYPDDRYDDYPDVPPPARNGSARNGSARRGPRPDDDHEPLYARDHTPLGYDGGDPDDPPAAPALLTHGGGGAGGDRDRRNGKPARGRNGFDRNGFDRDGFDREGFDREGFDREGFDREGFDRDGFDREGFDPDGFDRDGFDVDGYDRDGYPADDLDEDYDDAADEYGEYGDVTDDEDYDDDAYGVGDGPLAVPPPGSNGRPLGPADVEELDPSMTDALARVDLGAIQVPVPYGAELKLEGPEGGRPQAAHLMLPEGRIAVSALAAPRSAGLWPELCEEIEESLRGGGARVRSAHGDWGRELHASTENAASVFIGADGPRWMVYGVATAASDTVEALDVELRRVMRGIIVVRGKLPYPPRTVLPLERAEDRAAAENADKPRGASITVSVPAARPDGAATNGSGATTRTPAAADGATTRTPVAGGARNGAVRPARNGAAPGGVPRNGAPVPPPNGAVPPGPVRPGAPQAPAAGPDRTGGVPAPDRRRPAPPPAPQRPDVPAPAERPAANGVRRPPPGRPAEAAPPEPARGPAGRPGAVPDGRGELAAPVSAEETGVLRPLGAIAPGTPPEAGDAERPGAGRARRGDETGRGRTRGAAGGARRLRRDAGEPVAPRDDRRAPDTPVLPPVDAPAAGYAEETPVSGTGSVRRDDLLWTPQPSDDHSVAADRPDPAGDEPPTRRDPAVTSLPSFGPDAGPGRSARRVEPTPDTAWTPPSGMSAVGSGYDDLRGGHRGDDDEPTPRLGSRAAQRRPDPWETGAPTGRDRDEPPSWPDRVDAADIDPAPLSRMAIEDIPLADVPLVEATLDNAPVAPPPELPRRRPGGTRRRDAPAADGRGARRRAAPEEEVLSDWMSAEIAARPSGRHAGPGHRDRPSGNGTPVRSLPDWRGTDRAASGDLFRASSDGPDDDGGTRRGEGRAERRRGRGRTGTDGRPPASADDPMSLFRAPDDSGRHRR